MLEQNVLNTEKTSRVKHNGTSIFSYATQPLTAMRYHSLVAEHTSLPKCFDILATAMDDGEIMAVRHNYYPLFGLQFHPESIATEEGGKLIRAFFNRSKRGGKSMNNYLRKLVEGQHLTEEEMYKAGLLLLSENILESEIAAFLVLLKAKGETAEEIYGLVRALREKALPFSNHIQGAMDNCGTGGDGAQTFNISTTSAFVLAGAGVKVAKHGNRAVSSKTGSADLLEELGVNISSTPSEIDYLLEHVGIAFLFAPAMHPALRRIMKIRKELNVPTIFNLIGPLTNPVNLETQFVGIYKRDMLLPVAQVLQKLGRKQALVVNGSGFFR